MFTPNDLLKLSDSVTYELVDGRLIMRHAGMRCSWVGGQVAGILGKYVHENQFGHLVGPDAGFQCFPGAPYDVRKADVSFVSYTRLPKTQIPVDHCPVPPELAVEVIAPEDLAYEVQEKSRVWLNVGVQIVWVVYPHARTVHIHRPASSPHGVLSGLTESDIITGEDILPGFSAPVRAFFE
jgi:Uma2 family endonuclease